MNVSKALELTLVLVSHLARKCFHTYIDKRGIDNTSNFSEHLEKLCLQCHQERLLPSSQKARGSRGAHVADSTPRQATSGELLSLIPHESSPLISSYSSTFTFLDIWVDSFYSVVTQADGPQTQGKHVVRNNLSNVDLHLDHSRWLPRNLISLAVYWAHVRVEIFQVSSCEGAGLQIVTFGFDAITDDKPVCHCGRQIEYKRPFWVAKWFSRVEHWTLNLSVESQSVLASHDVKSYRLWHLK